MNLTRRQVVRWRTGLTVRTLHHYEAIGLFAPATRTDGQQRLYDERDGRRLYRIRALRDLGLSLAYIGRMLDDDSAALGDVLRVHLAQVEADLDRLQRLRVLLEHAFVIWIGPWPVLIKGMHEMVNEQIARNVGPSHLEIAYETIGDPSHPTVLLIMGLAAQLVSWPLGFLDALVARKLHVVRFDNRDVGRSTHLQGAPPADLPAVLRGDLSSASYTLSEMAADAVGLLQTLDIAAAHLVGASMGGAIAQTAAIEHPQRVLSLTSMMFTTGDKTVGQPHLPTMQAVFGGPPANTREEVIARAVRVSALTGSPAFPSDPAEVAKMAGLAYDRDHDEDGIRRQAVATVASGDRTQRLRQLAVPALVVHGLADTLCDPSGGRATAAAIPGAELVLIEGMGHNLPPGLWDRIADHIAAVVQRGEARRVQVAT